MEKNWKARTARDFLALGSWVFYALVLARSMVGLYRPFVDQIIVSGVFLILASSVLKDFDEYSARMLVLIVFTTIFYESEVFTAFALLSGIGVIISSRATKNSWRSIVSGILIGTAAATMGLIWTYVQYGFE